jgi:hypothetical protein
MDLTWTAELESALLRELALEVDHANRTWFGGALPRSVLRLTDDAGVLGRWIAGERTIELSRPLVLERPWGEVVEVLKHELAHQFVDEVLGVRDEPPHGPTFQRLCARCGIDARASGRPDASGADPRTARLIEKVRRLLALGSSPNQHEAELAMRRAHELMLEHEIALCGAERRYVFRQIGQPQQRKSRAERHIAGLLAEHFFVQGVWTSVYTAHLGRRERILEICGTEENVDMAAYVHAFLLDTARRLWAEARRRNSALGPGDRAAFMAGVIAGFRDKLDQARAEQQGTGLVWVGDAALEDYYHLRHPRLRRRRMGGTTRWAARRLGHEQGSKIVLHRPVEGGPSSGASPRLLRS